MTMVTLTRAQISAALNRSGHKLGSSQFSFSIPKAGSLWPTYVGTSEVTTSYQILSVDQAAAFRLALAGWDDLIAANFVETGDDASARGEIRVAFTGFDMDGDTGAYAYSGPPQPTGGKVGDVWINAASVAESFARGTGNYETLVHEIGHSLGLSHSFGDPGIPVAFDSTRYTVMSYTEAARSVVVSFALVGNSIRASFAYATAITPMVLDIAAVQAIYGADPTTRSGDTVYAFDQDATHFQSIYDAGGNDTIDLSQFTRPNTIDLTPGAYSTLGEFTQAAQVEYWTARFPGFGTFIASSLNRAELFTRTDNLGIALTTTIENAVGGRQSDSITGNAVANVLRGMDGADILRGGAGDDTLDGGAGSDMVFGDDGNDRIEGGADDDVMTGGAGADLFLFRETARATDTITDFTTGQDRIDLNGRSVTGVRTAVDGTALLYDGGEIILSGVTGLTLAQANALVVGAQPPPLPSQFTLIAGTGVQATVAGTGAVVGAGGVQDIVVRDVAGSITFGATFNGGGDRIHLSGAAAAWTAASSGSSVLLSDGDTRVQLPAGLVGVDLIFDDGIRTVRIDPDLGAILLGGQMLSATARPVTATPGAATAIDATDPRLPAQMILTGTGPVTAIGNLAIAGSPTSAETVVVTTGATLAFGATFNTGGDTIILPGAATSFSAMRSGSTVRLMSATETIALPAGTAGVTLSFAGGDSRALLIDPIVGGIRIGDQLLGLTFAPLAPRPTAALDEATIFAIVDPVASHVGMATPPFDALPEGMSYIV